MATIADITVSTDKRNEAASAKNSIHHVDALDNVSNQLDPSEKGSGGARELASNRPSALDLSPEDLEKFRKKMLWKMDIRLIPVLTLLYLLSFLDRNNIGNAAIQGLNTDLGLTPDQFNWCLTAFFFTYCAFELPSNLLLKKLRPSRWLPTIMVAWGTVMTLMGLVQDFKGLLIARLFLGVAEAGLPPGVAYYLTMWYTRDELQMRQALFFAGASTAGAFSGLLAFAIGKMDGVGNLAGWRWIFILEGLLTVVVAVFAFWMIYDFPDTASFLTEEEKAFAIYRLRYQGQGQVAVGEAQEFKWQYVKDAAKDWQIYTNVLVYWGIICPLYGISLFLPTILRNLGHSQNSAQLMTIPMYITAAIMAVVAAYFSDRVGKRSPFIMGLMSLMAVGYAMAIASANPNVVYAGVFLATIGSYASFPGLVAWLATNMAGSYKRAAGMAIQIGLGNMSGIMAANFYRARDAPRYFLGHGLELGFIGVGLIAATVLVFSYRRINHSRSRRVAAGEHLTMTPEALSTQGDRAITFRYVY